MFNAFRSSEKYSSSVKRGIFRHRKMASRLLPKKVLPLFGYTDCVRKMFGKDKHSFSHQRIIFRFVSLAIRVIRLLIYTFRRQKIFTFAIKVTTVGSVIHPM